jgi:hypothetical protein
MVAFSQKLVEDVENTMKVYHELLPLAATEADKEALREEYKQKTKKMIYDYDDIATKNATLVAQQKDADKVQRGIREAADEVQRGIKKKRKDAAIQEVQDSNARKRAQRRANGQISDIVTDILARQSGFRD